LSETSPENLLGVVVEDCLQRLGIALLSDWDVLVFLFRHPTSLVSPEQIGRLVGYPGNVISDALNTLESRGFIKRSRALQGVRLYQLVDSEALRAPEGCFRQMMALNRNRTGRLLLAKKLKRKRVAPHLVRKGSASA